MTRSRPTDGVEAVFRHADETLEDWFRQSRITTRQASVVFARFLDRAKQRGAGALRHQVDDLQVGLKRLSAGLEQLERSHRAVAPKRSTRPAASRKSAPKRKLTKAA